MIRDSSRKFAKRKPLMVPLQEEAELFGIIPLEHSVEDVQHSNNLYIGNLPSSMTQAEMDLLFWPFGEITSCRLMTHPDGIPKGYGFVEYVHRKGALAAMKHLNGRLFRGRGISVKMTKPAGEGAKRTPTIHTSSPHGRRVTYGMSDTNLYIGGLPDEITEEELRSLFAAYGEVEDVRRFVDRSTQRILGTACVRMSCAEDAAAALQGMNKASIKGKIIYCKYALDKAKKLAFHKPPPDKRLREQYYNNRNNFARNLGSTNLEPNTIETIVEQAVQHVFSKLKEYPQIKEAVGLQKPATREYAHGYDPNDAISRVRQYQLPVNTTQAVNPNAQYTYSPGLLPQGGKAVALQKRHQAIADNLQQHLAAHHKKRSLKWKKQNDSHDSMKPEPVQYNPAADTTYNPLVDSTVASVGTAKRFHPYSA